MKSRYSEAFIEQALIKVYSRGDSTIQSVAEELNINCHTVKNRMKRQSKQVAAMSVLAIKEKRPQDWNAEAKLIALHAWCRENGLFAHHLTSWKNAFCAGAKAAPGTHEMRTLKDENDQLKRELTRKERALAEAAALLILQKKFRALWEGEVK